MKFGIADYGLYVWYGGNFDTEERLRQLKAIGYQGLERLVAVSGDDAMQKAARFRQLGMDFATCLGPNPETCIQWTAGLGKDYVWVGVSGTDFDTFCRQANAQAAACARWGICVGLHNHMGTLVETQPQLEAFLERCPDCGLILDTAHLAAVDGDPLAIVERYADRLVAVHLKDWLLTNPEIGMDRWHARGRFCALGTGNIGLDNSAVMRALVGVGYDGWVFVEHDTHLQDPMVDLLQSREYLRAAGF